MKRLLKWMFWKSRYAKLRTKIYQRLLNKEYKVPMFSWYDGRPFYAFFTFKEVGFCYDKYTGKQIKGYRKPCLLIAYSNEPSYYHYYEKYTIDKRGNYQKHNEIIDWHPNVEIDKEYF